MSYKKAPICSFERTLLLGSIKKKRVYQKVEGQISPNIEIFYVIL